MNLLTKLLLFALPGGVALSGATITGFSVSALGTVTSSFTNSTAQFGATLTCGPASCSGVGDRLNFYITGTGLTAPAPVTIRITGIDNPGTNPFPGNIPYVSVMLELVPQELNLVNFQFGGGTTPVGGYNFNDAGIAQAVDATQSPSSNPPGIVVPAVPARLNLITAQPVPAGNFELLGSVVLNTQAKNASFNFSSFQITIGDPASIPEPGASLLLGSGLGLVVLLARRRSAQI